MLKLSFKQTKAEFMVRIASTLIFNQLVKANTKTVSIREITEGVQYGYTEKSSSDSDLGPKYVRITDLKDGQVNWETVPYCKCDSPEQYLLNQGDLIFARTGATTGKTHLFREKPPFAVFASYLIRVRPTKEINPEYLYFFFQSDLYWSQISDQKEGSAQPNVNGQKLSNIELPIADVETQKEICKFLAIVRARQDGLVKEMPELSYPLDGQRRILERIEIIAARIGEAQSLREEADIEVENLFQSRINELLEEKSKIWKMATLPEFVSSNRQSVKRGPFGSHLRKEFFVESGYKIYEQKHAIYGDFKAGRYYIDENKFQELKSFIVQPGDLIISCSGTIGKVAIVPEDAEPGIINQALLKITLDTKKIDRRFFKMVFESDFIKREVEAISPGSAMKNIGSVKILKKILFPLPPLDEQRRIVAYLDSVQARLASLRELQSATGEELSALLPSVLDRAFKGEL